MTPQGLGPGRPTLYYLANHVPAGCDYFLTLVNTHFSAAAADCHGVSASKEVCLALLCTLKMMRMLACRCRLLP
jgi:hypothetical protein